MNIERLTKLAELLDKVVEERKPFNLYCWTDEIDRSQGEGVFKSIASASDMTEEELSKHECGTVACAVGHACLDSWFNEQGLILDLDGQPKFENNQSWDAVAAFFEIGIELAIFLFDHGNYEEETETTAAEVAYRIRALIESETQA